jgi:secreted PhoX family phosphatase
MAAFPGPDGNVWLVRNHEVNGPGVAFGPGTPYDPQARGGTTTILVTPDGHVLQSFTSLNGTQMNCAGGRMPYGSWITCEETVNGPDVGPDFTGASNIPLRERHGFIFEVPAGGQSSREPVLQAGRFAHEAAALDPESGWLYLTEDNFGWPSALYRYKAPVHPMEARAIRDGGWLQMLAVKGCPNADLAAAQVSGAVYDVEWVDVDDPNPTFSPGSTATEEAPTSNDAALIWVGDQGRARGAAHFSRLEGATFSGCTLFFCSTQGGGAPEDLGALPISDNGFGNGSGQVWAYDTRSERLKCLIQSSGPAVLDLPDNVTTRTSTGAVVLCEDNVNDNFIRGLTRDGRLFDIALNRLRSASGTDRSNDEFAGATFSPDGGTLFANIQSSAGMTFAIWGPWDRLGV